MFCCPSGSILKLRGSPAHFRVTLCLHQMARQTGISMPHLTSTMQRRRASLPLPLDQASGIVQNSLTFLECQARRREASTNHAALQTCHGQKSLLAIAVPGQG